MCFVSIFRKPHPQPHPIARCALLGLSAVMFACFPRPVVWAASSPLAQWLQQARIALTQGDLDGMRSVLEKARQNLDKSSKFSPQQLRNARLWLDLLSAQYHQLKGPPPPFQRLHFYEKKEQVQSQVHDIQHSLKHTKAAAFFLEKYVRNFREVMRQGHVNDAITLTTTANRVQILKNTIRTLQNQLAHMDTLLRHWDKTSADARRMQFQMLLQIGKKKKNPPKITARLCKGYIRLIGYALGKNERIESIRESRAHSSNHYAQAAKPTASTHKLTWRMSCFVSKSTQTAASTSC